MTNSGSNPDDYPDLSQASDLSSAVYYTKPIQDGLQTDLGAGYNGNFPCLPACDTSVCTHAIVAGQEYRGIGRFMLRRILGEGGFSKVYEGTFHGETAAFKFSPMRDDQADDTNAFTNNNQGIWEYRRHMKSQSKFPTIVDKPLAYFIVKYDGVRYFVIVMPTHRTDLGRMIHDHWEEVKKVRKQILTGLTEMVCTDDYYRSHGDLKPSNILVDFQLDNNNHLIVDSFKFFVSDFGAAGWLEKHYGGTPFYAGPTTFEDSKSKDMYAFTRITLELYLPTNDWRQLVTLPIESNLESYRARLASSLPYISAIRNASTCSESNNTEVSYEQKAQFCQSIINQVEERSLDAQFMIDLAGKMRQQGMDYMMDNNGQINMSVGSQSIQFYELFNQSCYHTRSYNRYNSILSDRVHSQAGSFKCWAFSSASMLHVSCIRLIRECANLRRITENTRTRLENEINHDVQFHVHCRNLIMMVVLPKPIHRDTYRQSEFLKTAVSRVSDASITTF